MKKGAVQGNIWQIIIENNQLSEIAIKCHHKFADHTSIQFSLGVTKHFSFFN